MRFEKDEAEATFAHVGAYSYSLETSGFAICKDVSYLRSGLEKSREEIACFYLEA